MLIGGESCNNKNSKGSADKTLMYFFVWSDAKQHLGQASMLK